MKHPEYFYFTGLVVTIVLGTIGLMLDWLMAHVGTAGLVFVIVFGSGLAMRLIYRQLAKATTNTPRKSPNTVAKPIDLAAGAAVIHKGRVRNFTRTPPNMTHVEYGLDEATRARKDRR